MQFMKIRKLLSEEEADEITTMRHKMSPGKQRESQMKECFRKLKCVCALKQEHMISNCPTALLPLAYLLFPKSRLQLV